MLSAATLLAALCAQETSAQVAAGTISLSGKITDFAATHPDFNVTNPADMGQYAGIVAPTLDPSGKPVFAAPGREVTAQWIDKDLNPIRPYGDRGLFGGHFDVDVFDVEGSTSEIMHEHEFDDLYNVTYVDIANDPNLLYDVLVGPAYPNDVRVTFSNHATGGGGGSFRFRAGPVMQSGLTSNGFTAVFSPALLTNFRINFASLSAMRQTEPGFVQGDGINRDGALRVRMYDTVTNVMIYELTVYNHFQGAAAPIVVQPPLVGNDNCGVPLGDTVGAFGVASNAGTTDSAAFRQWFSTVPGTNISTSHSIDLTLNGMGEYEYRTNAFFPIDNALFGNDGATHNNFFTYHIATTFTYRACTGQFFEFETGDDAWVFINNELVIDLGGSGTTTKQYVALDRLNLVDGQIYPLDLFYARRVESPTSQFNLRTNIALRPVTQLTSTPYD